jgi:hypothetical protein
LQRFRDLSQPGDRHFRISLLSSADSRRNHGFQMSENHTAEAELTKEQRILAMVKRVLTDVARDTHAPPGIKHPLTDNTINGIRDCLHLIVAREQELADAVGQEMNMRPRYVDEPRKNTVVPINIDGLRKKPKPE